MVALSSIFKVGFVAKRERYFAVRKRARLAELRSLIECEQTERARTSEVAKGLHNRPFGTVGPEFVEYLALDRRFNAESLAREQTYAREIEKLLGN